MKNFEHECNCNGRECMCANGHTQSQMMRYNVGGEDLYLSQEEFLYLTSLFADLDFPIETTDWEERLLNEANYTILADMLFTIHRIEDAWEAIEQYKEDIDFTKLTLSPYFQIKRDAKEVYKYMYENDIIDANSYMYFEILSGRLNDTDFWRSVLNGKTTSEKLMLIHESFNGVNPFELGLVALDTEEVHNMIFGNIAEDEKLDDFILGQYPGVFFDNTTLIELIENNHLDSMNYDKYFGIMLQMLLKDNEDADYSDHVFNDFWNLAYNIMGTRIAHIQVDSKKALYTFIASDVCSDIIAAITPDRSSYILDTILINSIEFMSHPYSVMNTLYNMGLYESYKVSGTCLFERNYPYAITYKMCDAVDTENFIIKYPFPTGMNCIYDKVDNLIYINGEVKPYDEYDLAEFDFVDKYLNNGGIDDEIMTKCQDIDDYEEHVYAVKMFNEEIQNTLG